METENTNFQTIKKVMIDGMTRNFKNDGFLSPLVFFFVGNQLELSNIPDELLANDLGKSILGSIIRTKCSEPDTILAGMIFEAYGKKLNDNDDDELKESLLNGEIRVSELDEKQDIIVMIISSPEKQEIVTFDVDPQNKTVGELFDTPEIFYDGIWDMKFIEELNKKMENSPNTIEGYVVRLAREYHYSEFRNVCGKYVRKNHVQNNHGHWKQQKIVKNEVI